MTKVYSLGREVYNNLTTMKSRMQTLPHKYVDEHNENWIYWKIVGKKWDEGGTLKLRFPVGTSTLPLWQTMILVLSKKNILCGCHQRTEKHYSVYLCNSSHSGNPSGNPFSWSWVQSIKMKENDVNVFILIFIYQMQEKPSISSLFVSWESR